MHEYLCIMCLVPKDIRKKASDPLQLNLRVVVTILRVLRIEPESSARVAGALTTGLSLQVSSFLTLYLFSILSQKPEK